MPQGRARLLISGAPYRPPKRASQLLLTHEGWRPPPTDGFEALEREIAMVEWRLDLMKKRLAKLRARRSLRMVTISKISPDPVKTKSA